MVGLQPEAILTRTTPVTAAVFAETRTIAIVFVGASDPVGDGLVASFARPGGNVTGFTNVEASLGGKWLELLKEIVPEVARVGVIYNPKTSPGRGSFYLRAVEDAARSMGVEATARPIQNAGEIERAIETLAPNGGLVVLPDVTTQTHRDLIISLAAKHRLPAVYGFSYFATNGGLAAYGVDIADLYRRAGSYVDRILRGTKPSDLPVQAPTRFELVINLRTAKTLGITVPPMLLAHADEVIE